MGKIQKKLWLPQASGDGLALRKVWVSAMNDQVEIQKNIAWLYRSMNWLKERNIELAERGSTRMNLPYG